MRATRRRLRGRAPRDSHEDGPSRAMHSGSPVGHSGRTRGRASRQACVRCDCRTIGCRSRVCDAPRRGRPRTARSWPRSKRPISPGQVIVRPARDETRPSWRRPIEERRKIFASTLARRRRTGEVRRTGALRLDELTRATFRSRARLSARPATAVSSRRRSSSIARSGVRSVFTWPRGTPPSRPAGLACDTGSPGRSTRPGAAPRRRDCCLLAPAWRRRPRVTASRRPRGRLSSRDCSDAGGRRYSASAATPTSSVCRT